MNGFRGGRNSICVMIKSAKGDPMHVDHIGEIN